MRRGTSWCPSWTPRESPTVNVSADDFVVEEGHDERDILSARVGDYPVAILLDVGSGSAGSGSPQTLEAITNAVINFVTRIGRRPVAVATLTDPPAILANFEDDRERVLSQLATVSATPADVLRPLPALTRASELIAESKPPFSVVVVLTARPVDLTEQPIAERITSILDSGAALHVIALRQSVAGPPGPNDERDLLQTLSAQTHGQYVADLLVGVLRHRAQSPRRPPRHRDGRRILGPSGRSTCRGTRGRQDSWGAGRGAWCL